MIRTDGIICIVGMICSIGMIRSGGMICTVGMICPVVMLCIFGMIRTANMLCIVCMIRTVSMLCIVSIIRTVGMLCLQVGWMSAWMAGSGCRSGSGAVGLAKFEPFSLKNSLTSLRHASGSHKNYFQGFFVFKI